MSATHLFLTLLLAAPGASGPERLTCRPKPPAPNVQRMAVGAEVRTGNSQRRRAVLPDGSALFLNEQTTLKLTAARRLKLSAGEVFVEAAPGEVPFVVVTPKREVSAVGTAFAVRTGKAGTGVLVVRGRVTVSAVEKPLLAGQRLAVGGDKAETAPRASHTLAWVRELMASAEPALVPASKHAGGSLVARSADGREANLSLRKYHVDVHVEDGFARTTIDQTYFNPQRARLEGTFRFPLPADASLSRLAMYVDGTRMEGGMVERDYGRNVYESIVERQKDPALLEWVDGTTFQMRVFPLEPRQEKRILLSYTQKLPSLYGEQTYRFPAGHSLGKVGVWSFHARIKGGAALAWNSSSHGLKASKDNGDLLLDAAEKDSRFDRDVVLTLGSDDAAPEAARLSSAEQDGAKYLMVRFRPELPVSPQWQRRDWVFLVESSGDRDPLLARTQVEIVRGLLHNAEPGDTFAVLTAGTRVKLLAKRPQPVTPRGVQEAIAFLEGVHLIGALNLERALAEAEPLLRAGKEPYLVHVGSGIAAMGEQRQDVLVKHIPEGTRYVGIGVGRRWDRGFMKAAAERSGGYFTQVNPDEPVSWRAFELAATLNTPRLLDVRVRDDSGKNRYLTFTSLAAYGEEVCAVTRLDGDGELPQTLTVHGTLNGRPFERELAVKGVADRAGYLPRTWAKLEIERLLTEDALKHKEAIVALSKAMVVMTPFTSLLVLESEAMYQQYKVDRGRKDHWALYACPEKIPVFSEDEDGNRIDPRKDAKPTPRQVLETVLRREVASTPAREIMKTGNFNDWSAGLRLAAPLGYRSRQLSQDAASIMYGIHRFDINGIGRRLEASPVDFPPTVTLEDTARMGPEVAYEHEVGGSVVVGNTPSRQNVILRQIPLYAGQPLSYPALREAARNLARPGIFEGSGMY